MWKYAFAALITLGGSTAFAEPVSVAVETLDGQTVRGAFTSLAGGTLTLDDGDTELGVENIAAITADDTPAKSAAPVTVTLLGGSRLSGSSYLVEGGTAKLAISKDAEPLEFPARLILSVRFASDQSDAARDRQWETIRMKDHRGDALVIRREAALDFVSGVIKDISADKVTFELDGDAIPVDREKVEGLVYFHAKAPEFAEPQARITGSGLTIEAAELSADDQQLQVATVSGVELSVPLSTVEKMDFTLGKIVPLAGLDPLAVKWTNFFPEIPKLHFVRGKSLSGTPIRLEGTDFRTGISLRSRTELEYRVPQEMNRFKAVAGIDDAVRPGGHVRLTIAADGDSLFDETITGRDDPMPLDLKVTGKRRLTILVDYGEDQDVADHLDLAGAVFIK